MGESVLNERNRDRAEIICFGLAIISLFLYNAYKIQNFYTFIILNDELGYWANASHFAGIDWSGVMHNVPYYSFGYSFLLAPLFWFIESPVIMYRAALFLNALFVCGCFLVSYILAKRVVPSSNKYILILICFTTSVYPAYAVQGSIAWPECLMFLLIWILTLCFFVLSDSPTYYMTVITSVLLVFVYIVHQRALGVLIAGVIVVMLLRIGNKINNMQILIFAVCLSVLLFASSVIKSDLYNSLYASARETGGNDYGSAINKARSLLNIDGIYKMFASLCGQVYYLGASTFLFFYYGAWVVFKKIITAIRDRKSGNGNVFNFGFAFLLLSVLGTIGISVIAMAGGSRADHLLYGRYNEMIIGPVFLFGLISLIEETDKKKIVKIFLFSGLLQLGLSIFTRYNLAKNNFSEINPANVTGLYRAAGPANGYNTFYAFFFSVFFAGLILLLSIKFPKSKIALSFGALSIAGAFVFLAYQYIPVCENTSKLYYQLETIAKYVNINENRTLPVYHPAQWRSKAHIQFFMKERPLQIFTLEKINELPAQDKILITGFNLSDDTLRLMQDYDLGKAVSNYMVWKTREPTDEPMTALPQIILSLDGANTQNGIYDENINALTSNGKQGYLVFGPYATIDKGQYLCEFEMTLLDHTQYELGNVDIANSGEPIEIMNINADSFSANGTAKFSILFSCADTLPSAEFRVFTTKGTIMQVNMISIELVDKDPV